MEIQKLIWSEITVNDETYKDIRIWNWKKTGTRHIPRIQIADLEDFINEVDTIILSTGYHGMLKVKKETEEYLKENKKDYKIKIYNQLVKDGKKVGGLFHSTC